MRGVRVVTDFSFGWNCICVCVCENVCVDVCVWMCVHERQKGRWERFGYLIGMIQNIKQLTVGISDHQR